VEEPRFGIWVRSFGASEIVRLAAADNRGAVYLASEGFQNDFVAPAVIGR
jgi:hypothetical protein